MAAEGPSPRGWPQAAAGNPFADTGLLGVSGRGDAALRLLARLEAAITRLGRDPSVEVLRFPPVLSRRVVERCGYLHTFPHLLGTVHTFVGGPRDHARLIRAVEDGADWGALQTLSDVVLTPAACYAVYPHLVGTVPPGGRVIDVESWCYRHEPSADPARMRSFRMREFVCVGEPERARGWRDAWIARADRFARALGLDAAIVPANDPFFGPGGRLMAASQREQDLKLELVARVAADGPPVALMSFNLHGAHFGDLFGIITEQGAAAHTSCVGFGMERLALALLAAHGDEAASVAVPDAAAPWEDL